MDKDVDQRGVEQQLLKDLERRAPEQHARACAQVGADLEPPALVGQFGLADHLDLARVASLSDSPNHLEIFVGDPGSGFRSPELGFVLLDESEVLGRRRSRRS